MRASLELRLPPGLLSPRELSGKLTSVCPDDLESLEWMLFASEVFCSLYMNDCAADTAETGPSVMRHDTSMATPISMYDQNEIVAPIPA